jgi:hypothetical protein
LGASADCRELGDVMSATANDQEADLAAALREAVTSGFDVSLLLDDDQATLVAEAFAEMIGGHAK